MPLNKFFNFVLMVVLLGMFSPTQAQNPREHLYYLEYFEEQPPIIRGINPLTMLVDDMHTLDHTQIEAPRLSTDGQWFAYGIASEQSQYTEDWVLLNVINGETTVFAEGITAPMFSGTNSAIWSPNARYFSLVSREDDTQKVLILDTTTGATTSVEPPDNAFFDNEIFWANTSNQFAVVTIEVHRVEGQNYSERIYRLALVDAATATITQLIKLSEDPISNYGFCHLEWAPDDSAVAYSNHCNDSDIQPQELKLLDLETEDLRVITDFTPDMGQYFISDTTYSLNWRNTTQIIIGVSERSFDFEDDSMTPNAATYLYDTQAETLTQIDAGHWRWIAQSRSGLIAYTRLELPTEFTDGWSSARWMNPSVHIAELVNGAYRDVHTLDFLGCRHVWSTLDHYLALLHNTDSIGACTHPEMLILEDQTSLVILDAETGELKNVPVANGMMLGWVMLI